MNTNVSPNFGGYHLDISSHAIFKFKLLLLNGKIIFVTLLLASNFGEAVSFSTYMPLKFDKMHVFRNGDKSELF